MKQYLIDTFRYNEAANTKLLTKILQLPEKAQAVKYFSHLINSQNKWMARITDDESGKQLDWWDPAYPEAELESKWHQSVSRWLEYIHARSEEQLATEIIYTGYDGSKFAATPIDIALQLNYHSIHHRAQIQTMIRSQGLEPDFLDYIGTKYRRIES